jgi:hypothetical protein
MSAILMAADVAASMPGVEAPHAGTANIVFQRPSALSRDRAVWLASDDDEPEDPRDHVRDMAFRSHLLFTRRAREQMAAGGLTIDDIDRWCTVYCAPDAPRTPVAVVRGDPIVIVVGALEVTHQCPTCLKLRDLPSWHGRTVLRGVELAAHGLRCPACDEQLIDAAEMWRLERRLARLRKRSEKACRVKEDRC